MPERTTFRGSPLFPTHEERKWFDDLLTHELPAVKERVAKGAVMPALDREAFRNQLAKFDFSAPLPLSKVLTWALTQLEHGVVHVTHPRYFGLFNPAPTFPSECADRIAAAFNPQLATATTSPAAVEIEAHVIAEVAKRAGFPSETAGHFTSGGTEANCTALISALTRANQEFATKGARAFAGPPVFYASREGHHAWLKIAHQAGIGRAAVRLVATNGSGQMDPCALADALQSDRRDGRVPIMIVATAGTTNAGMIDPLEACAEIARSADVWYHVDAAWGGALVASDMLRPLLAGLEQADSVTIDAHKWFATTMGCGMFFTKWPAVLSSAFQVSANYMPSSTPGLDPYITTTQWSRRFLGLRLFLSLAAAGWPSYAALVERAVALIQLLRDTLAERGWRVANEALLAVLCVWPPPGSADVRSIVRHVVTSGRAWVSLATFEGRDVIRMCLTNAETAEDDVLALADVLEAAR